MKKTIIITIIATILLVALVSGAYSDCNPSNCNSCLDYVSLHINFACTGQSTPCLSTDCISYLYNHNLVEYNKVYLVSGYTMCEEMYACQGTTTTTTIPQSTITRAELGTMINQWVNGQISRAALANAIQLWVNTQ